MSDVPAADIDVEAIRARAAVGQPAVGYPISNAETLALLDAYEAVRAERDALEWMVNDSSATIERANENSDAWEFAAEQAGVIVACPECRSGNVSTYDRDLATFACEYCGCRPFGFSTAGEVAALRGAVDAVKAMRERWSAAYDSGMGAGEYVMAADKILALFDPAALSGGSAPTPNEEKR